MSGHEDLWSYIHGLREDLGHAESRIHELEERLSVYGETLDDLRNRVYALEHGTPAARLAQYEADVAMADLRESGWSEEGDR